MTAAKKKTKKKADKPFTGTEKRRSKRRPILDTFSVFCVAPSKSICKLAIQDLSDNGIGFILDSDSSDLGLFQVTSGEEVALQFYLNQSLFIPMTIRVARIQEGPDALSIGGEFVSSKSPGLPALKLFMKMLDELTQVAKIKK